MAKSESQGRNYGSDFYDSNILLSRSISRLAVSFACIRSLSSIHHGGSFRSNGSIGSLRSKPNAGSRFKGFKDRVGGELPRFGNSRNVETSAG